MEHLVTYLGTEKQLAVLSVYSVTNTWMQYAFTVPTQRTAVALKVLEVAWDNWWDNDPAETLWEALDYALSLHGIEHISVATDLNGVL